MTAKRDDLVFDKLADLAAELSDTEVAAEYREDGEGLSVAASRVRAILSTAVAEYQSSCSPTNMRLKSWTHFFQAIKAGTKTHDLRSKKDRDFHVGQILTLCEYDQFAGTFTGDEIDVEVTFITDDVTPCAFSSAVLEKGYAILSIRRVDKP